MANKHKYLEKDNIIDIELKFKVRVNSLSDYNRFSEERVKSILEMLPEELKMHFMWKISQERVIETVGCDYAYFELED